MCEIETIFSVVWNRDHGTNIFQLIVKLLKSSQDAIIISIEWLFDLNESHFLDLPSQFRTGNPWGCHSTGGLMTRAMLLALDHPRI